jgi:hypothetical protein
VVLEFAESQFPTPLLGVDLLKFTELHPSTIVLAMFAIFAVLVGVLLVPAMRFSPTPPTNRYQGGEDTAPAQPEPKSRQVPSALAGLTCPSEVVSKLATIETLYNSRRITDQERDGLRERVLGSLAS